MRYLPIIAVALFAVTSCSSRDTPETTINQAIERLVENPENYIIEIQAAGTATIDGVTATRSGFELGYRYDATDGSGEQRAGAMTLSSTGPRSAEGQWRTEAATGAVYSGELRFSFADDGTASGTYDFAGVTYEIMIVSNI